MESPEQTPPAQPDEESAGTEEGGTGTDESQGAESNTTPGEESSDAA